MTYPEDGAKPYDPYEDDEIQPRKNLIYELKAMRDAQPPGSPNYLHYQTRITQVTDELRAWEEAAQGLRLLDNQLVNATRLSNRLRGQADRRSDLMFTTVKVSLLFGLGLLAIAVVFDAAAWTIVVGIVLVALAGVVTAHAVRSKPRRYAEADDAAANVADIQWRRDAAEPGTRVVYPAAEHVPEPEPEPEPAKEFLHAITGGKGPADGGPSAAAEAG